MKNGSRGASYVMGMKECIKLYKMLSICSYSYDLYMVFPFLWLAIKGLAHDNLKRWHFPSVSLCFWSFGFSEVTVWVQGKKNQFVYVVLVSMQNTHCADIQGTVSPSRRSDTWCLFPYVLNSIVGCCTHWKGAWREMSSSLVAHLEMVMVTLEQKNIVVTVVCGQNQTLAGQF